MTAPHMFYYPFMCYNPFYPSLQASPHVMELGAMDPRFGLTMSQPMVGAQSGLPEGLGLAPSGARAVEAVPEEQAQEQVQEQAQEQEQEQVQEQVQEEKAEESQSPAEEWKQGEKHGRGLSARTEKRGRKKWTTTKRSHQWVADSSGKNPGRWQRDEHNKFVEGG